MSYEKLVIEESEPHVRENALQLLNNILLKLPLEITELIEQAFVHKRIPKEYMLSSILFAFSNAAGLAFKLKHGGYENYANLYLALIGSRGDAKSPAMGLATAVLNDFDDNGYDTYLKDKNEVFNNIGQSDESAQTYRQQALIQNATIEAAMFTHYKNPYSIGIFVDELFYLIEKMSNSNSSEGKDWRTFLLQGSTNQHIDVSRKTTDSYRIKKSYPTLLGSIQHQFLPKMFANGNLESGFIDRILFTTRLTSNSTLTKDDIPTQVVENYNNSLKSLLDYRKAIEGDKKCLTLLLDNDAEDMIHDYVQKLIHDQSKLPDKEREYNAKMQISIYKLTILFHLINNSINSNYQSKISANTVDLAILINRFYMVNFKLVLGQERELINEKVLLKEIIRSAIKFGATQRDVVAVTGKSKGYISKLWNKYADKETGNWKRTEENLQNF